MAWYLRSRPPLAEPPADSPSTMKISPRPGSRSWQSASFPGRPPESIADFRRVNSRALRAASRARAASMHLPTMRRATVGCLSNHSRSFLFTRCFTFAENGGSHIGMLGEPFAEFFVHELLDVTFDVAVELAFGLPFELRL